MPCQIWHFGDKLFTVSRLLLKNFRNNTCSGVSKFIKENLPIHLKANSEFCSCLTGNPSARFFASKQPVPNKPSRSQLKNIGKVTLTIFLVVQRAIVLSNAAKNHVKMSSVNPPGLSTMHTGGCFWIGIQLTDYINEPPRPTSSRRSEAIFRPAFLFIQTPEKRPWSRIGLKKMSKFAI
jgi:hypothetical protein